MMQHSTELCFYIKRKQLGTRPRQRTWSPQPSSFMASPALPPTWRPASSMRCPAAVPALLACSTCTWRLRHQLPAALGILAWKKSSLSARVLHLSRCHTWLGISSPRFRCMEGRRANSSPPSHSPRHPNSRRRCACTTSSRQQEPRRDQSASLGCPWRPARPGRFSACPSFLLGRVACQIIGRGAVALPAKGLPNTGRSERLLVAITLRGFSGGASQRHDDLAQMRCIQKFAVSLGFVLVCVSVKSAWHARLLHSIRRRVGLSFAGQPPNLVEFAHIGQSHC
jgi:hypothetical protein